jgi:hypothetical protein
MATWMSTRTGKALHSVQDDGSAACTSANRPSGGWIERNELPHCSLCTRATAEEIQSADVVSATGATYRQIDYWVRQGYINPTPRINGAGSGTPRVWPAEELKVAREMAVLVAVGLLPDAAHRAARSGGVLAPGVRIVVDQAVAA